MRRRARVAIVVVGSLLVFGRTGRSAGGDAAEAAAERPQATELVEQALRAELKGNAAGRAAALAQAGDADAADQAARWQAGEVLLDGRWTPVEQAERFAAKSERMIEYRRLKREATDATEDHRDLARWCGDHRLPEEAQYHWSCVIQDEPADAEARQALGLVERHGQLFFPEEIVRAAEIRKQLQRNLDRFVPEYRQLVRQAARDDSTSRQQALAKIRAIRDPAAMPALQQVISREAVDRKNGLLKRLPETAWKSLVIDLHAALLGALGEMPQREATIDLLNYALTTTWPEIRKPAVEALRLRSATEYVPLLMAELAAPIEFESDGYVAADGSLFVATKTSQSGPTANYSYVKTTSFDVLPRLDETPLQRVWLGVRNLIRNSPRAAQLLRQAETDAATQNAMIAARNRQVSGLLAQVSDQNIDWTASQWWQAWAQYNEVSLADETPTQEQFVVNTINVNTMMSCFPAGTPVWTKAGRVPIETIAVGDFVLAQHPQTGELAYRPVVGRTVRPPSRLVRLNLPGEVLLATRGHRFWVAGEGWQMAKLLEAGRLLHGVRGSIELGTVDLLGEEEQAEAFNLIVDEFHTYLVGESRLLVHDNGCPAQTRCALPGMAPGVDWTQRPQDRQWLQSVLDEQANLH